MILSAARGRGRNWKTACIRTEAAGLKPALGIRRYNEIPEVLIVTYQEIAEREQKYLLNTYARYPIAMARGDREMCMP